jgi:molybdopterin synthase catalytic subunit
MTRKLYEMMEAVRGRIDPNKVGMLACHNGIVRGTSRAGEPAEYLEISKDQEAWDEVLETLRSRPGIAAVDAHLFTGRREIGEDVLLVVVAGDIREHVLAVLEEAVNQFKSRAVLKKEKLR